MIDVTVHEEESFFLARTVDLLVKGKCGKGHDHPSTLGRREGGRGVPGDGEAYHLLTLPASAPLGTMQFLWLTLKEKLGPYL